MTKNYAFKGEKQIKKSNGEQSDFCDLEQVTLEPQLQVDHWLTTWLQIWYHSLLWGDSIRKGADLKTELLIRRPPRGNGEINFSSLKHCFILKKTSRERRKSAPYIMLKNSTRTSKCQSIFFYSTRKTHGDPFGFFNIHFVAKYQKNEGGSFGDIENFRKKSLTMPKKLKGAL